MVCFYSYEKLFHQIISRILLLAKVHNDVPSADRHITFKALYLEISATYHDRSGIKPETDHY